MTKKCPKCGKSAIAAWPKQGRMICGKCLVTMKLVNPEEQKMKDTGLVRPDYTQDGVPECSPECPSKTGERCKVISAKPGLLCRPAVVEHFSRRPASCKHYDGVDEGYHTCHNFGRGCDMACPCAMWESK
jgi:uncharacterized Zn finger protein (UPF0148 family)